VDTGGKGVCESYPTIGLPTDVKKRPLRPVADQLNIPFIDPIEVYPVTRSEVFTTSMMLN